MHPTISRWLARCVLGLVLVIGLEADAVLVGPLAASTLDGLSGVMVVVEKFREDALKARLSERTLQTDVELNLRIAGIRVLSREEWEASPRMPFLQVLVVPFDAGGVFIYATSIALYQTVLLPGIAESQIGATWSVVALGRGSNQDIRQAVGNQVDEFMNAWLSVNPRLAPASPD